MGRAPARARRVPLARRRARLWRGALLYAARAGGGEHRAASQLRTERAGGHGTAKRPHHARHLACHDLGLLGREPVCPRQRLYRQAPCGYRRSRKGRAATGRNQRTGARSSVQPERGYGESAQSDAAAGASEFGAGEGDVGPGPTTSRARLGDPAAGHDRHPDLKAREAAVRVAQANVRAQEALLKVLNQQRAYRRVVAPFDGVITARNIDVGSLVQADAASGTFLFTIMQSDVIRTQVYVPQDQAFGVTPGVDAVVRVPELPGRTFPGKVTRIADALQPGTRTLLTEIDVPNPDHTLMPGTYCTVELQIPR